MADDWTFNLVFEAPDGAFHVEPRRHAAALGAALALAKRDGVAGAFGRTFRGFSAIEPNAEPVTVGRMPRASRVEADPTRPTAELLAPHGLEADVPPAAESPRHPVPLEGLEATPWWDFEGAYGMGTRVGVSLGRCASTDETEAQQAAALLGESIAHHQQLFSVTAPALPFMVALMSTPQVSCRAALAGWLEIIAASAFEANDTMSNLVALAAKLFARDQAEAMAGHQKSALAVSEQLAQLRPRLEALCADAALGEKVSALLRFVPPTPAS